jgi:MFS family permease
VRDLLRAFRAPAAPGEPTGPAAAPHPRPEPIGVAPRVAGATAEDRASAPTAPVVRAAPATALSAPAAPPDPAAAPRTRLGTTFRALRNYNYRLFWGGQFFSLTGSWIQRTGLAWLVLEMTGSPLALGTVTMLQFLPISLLALFGGVVADRFSKRQVLIVTQILVGAQAIVLAALVSSGSVQLWHLYVLSLIQGTFLAVDNPARSALVMELVGREDLSNAVALNSGNFNLSRIVGPAVGGVLIATVGMAACFWVNAASYVGPLVGLLLMRPAEFHDVPPPARGSVRRQLAEGIGYVLRTPALFGALLLVFTFGAFGFNFISIIPLLARFVYETGPEGYGVLSSCLGLGSLVAALVVAGREQASRRVLFGAAASFAVLLGCVALTPWYALGALLLLVLGFATIAFAANSQTLIQYAAPGQMRGRVMSLHTVLNMGMTPLGALSIGGLSEYLGVRLALGVLCGLCCLGTVATWCYLRYRLGPNLLADS